MENLLHHQNIGKPPIDLTQRCRPPVTKRNPSRQFHAYSQTFLYLIMIRMLANTSLDPSAPMSSMPRVWIGTKMEETTLPTCFWCFHPEQRKRDMMLTVRENPLFWTKEPGTFSSQNILGPYKQPDWSLWRRMTCEIPLPCLCPNAVSGVFCAWSANKKS